MTGKEIERVISNGTTACREKFYADKNRRKKDTRGCPIEELFRLLAIEVDELKAELNSQPEGRIARIRAEAADVANFAMAIIDKYDGLLDRDDNA
jgi:hypothetical protein